MFFQLKRIARGVVITATIVLATWLVLIEAPMCLTRWRISRLLADDHSIRPTESSWQDARRLMTRWGRWGGYQGTCTSTDCDYSIVIPDVYTNWLSHLSPENQERVYNSHFLQLANRIGYHTSRVYVAFQVQDARIVRTSTSILIEVVDSGPPDHWEYGLGIIAQVNSNLSRHPRRRKDFGIYGQDEQLELHPDYKVYRPSGCEGCEIVHIAYTPSLPHEQQVQFTDFNLACLTRLHPCTSVSDLLPFGQGWNLYDDKPSNLYPKSKTNLLTCNTQPRALARDAGAILEVQALASLPNFKTYDEERELTTVRVLGQWKGSPAIEPGQVIQVSPFNGAPANLPYWPAEAAEHLTPGEHVFLMLPEGVHPTQFDKSSPPNIAAFTLERCGIVEDSPENRAAVKLGIEQDKAYREPLDNTLWR